MYTSCILRVLHNLILCTHQQCILIIFQHLFQSENAARKAEKKTAKEKIQTGQIKTLQLQEKPLVTSYNQSYCFSQKSVILIVQYHSRELGYSPVYTSSKIHTSLFILYLSIGLFPNLHRIIMLYKDCCLVFSVCGRLVIMSSWPRELDGLHQQR